MMWIAFAILAAVFFVVFLLSVFLKDRPTSSEASRQFDPLRGVKDWGTRQAMKHTQQEMAWQNVKAEYERHPLSIERSHEMSDKGHELWQKKQQVEQATAELQRQQVLEATTQRIDVPTLTEFKKLEKAHELELQKLMESTQVEVQKHREMKQIDVQAYAHEVRVDLEAALTKRILDHKTVRRIEAEFQELVRERALIEADTTLTPHSRLLALSAKDALIEAFRKNLNEQMERRLLQTGNGEDVQGMDESS